MNKVQTPSKFRKRHRSNKTADVSHVGERHEWIPPSQWDLPGIRDFYQVMVHPHVQQFHQLIVQHHVRRSDIAIVLPCSSRKPYIRSRQYQVMEERLWQFGVRYVADIVFLSSLGVVPIQFCTKYPAAHYTHGGDELEIKRWGRHLHWRMWTDMLYRRWKNFLQHHPYKFLVAHIPPGEVEEDQWVLREVCEELGVTLFECPSRRVINKMVMERNKFPLAYGILQAPHTGYELGHVLRNYATLFPLNYRVPSFAELKRLRQLIKQQGNPYPHPVRVVDTEDVTEAKPDVILRVPWLSKVINKSIVDPVKGPHIDRAAGIISSLPNNGRSGKRTL